MRDLVESDPSGAGEAQSSEAPAPFDPRASVAQLSELMQMYERQGLIHQRPDGSYVVPGAANPQQEAVAERGSACDCLACSPHDQRHWRCVICLTQYEWAIQRPRASWPMGRTGYNGMLLFAVDSDACAREFLARQKGRDTVAGGFGGVDRPVPVAGGDEGFFLPQA